MEEQFGVFAGRLRMCNECISNATTLQPLLTKMIWTFTCIDICRVLSLTTIPKLLYLLDYSKAAIPITVLQ